MNKIFHYLTRKTKFYTIIGALANGGLALAQPLVVSQALSLNQEKLTYSKIMLVWLFLALQYTLVLQFNALVIIHIMFFVEIQ